MIEIECPKPAFDRLVNAGIEKRILGKQRILHEMYLDHSYFSGDGEVIIRWAEDLFSKREIKVSQESESARDILDLKFEVEDSFSGIDIYNVADLFIQHPSFFARLILGKDVLKFREYRFPTRRSLEEAVSSFCIGEYATIMNFDGRYIWRNGNKKNEISLNVHGDLCASQIDVSGKDRTEETLFGREEVFDSVKKGRVRYAIQAYQDWSVFLISLLRYAQAIGKSKISEIVNWQQVVEQTGSIGTNTAEALGGFGMDYIPFLMQEIILKEGEKLDGPPLSIYYRETSFIPMVKGNKLIYLGETEEEGFELKDMTRFFCGEAP